MKRLVALLTVLLLALGTLTACSTAEDHPGAQEAVEALIAGLESGDLADVALTANTAETAQLDFDQVFAGMGVMKRQRAGFARGGGVMDGARAGEKQKRCQPGAVTGARQEQRFKYANETDRHE